MRVLRGLLAIAAVLDLGACAHAPAKPVSPQEVEHVKSSFQDAIREDLFKNKKDIRLGNIDVKTTKVEETSGDLKVDYRLVYDEQLEDGEVITYEFEAHAFLERDGDGWKAKKLRPTSQTLTFHKGLTVTPSQTD